MKGSSIVGLGAAAFVLIGSFYACGGKSASPSSPTPNPTPSATGSITIKGSTSVTGAAADPVMLPGTPTSVKVRMYKAYLSKNADCSSPTLVQDKGGSADYQDLIGKPTLFSGTIATGTYQCLVVKVSDLLKFTPDASAQAASGGVCMAGRENDFDILKDETPAESWYDVDSGSTVAGAGSYGNAVPQDVFLFVSTNPTAVTGANPRVHVHQLVALANPIVITASQVTSGAFVFDAANRIAVTTDGMGGAWCWLQGVIAQYVGQ